MGAGAKAEMASCGPVELSSAAEVAELPPVSSILEVSTAASELLDGDQKMEVAAAAATDDTAFHGPMEFQIVAAAERRVVSSNQEARDQVLDNGYDDPNMVGAAAAPAPSSRWHRQLGGARRLTRPELSLIGGSEELERPS
jgi:hypothetical protein